ncbi:MAG: hypothetical protein LBU89_09385 [Fibromonadaceae bacterium]|nr:hypothetical protein [Fibromonadaceae bacterium]
MTTFACDSPYELTPAIVDSVIAAFTLGFQGGALTFIPFVAGAVAIIITIHLLVYGASKT